MAPEIFNGQKHTKASDIYSFGMIMWELMTGRKPFWDENEDSELILKIFKGFRPPIVTNAPMKECWDSDPKKRPIATELNEKIKDIVKNEWDNPTEIIESSDIGP